MSSSIDAFKFTLLSELPHSVSLVNDNARGPEESEKKAIDAILTGLTRIPYQRR